MIKIILDRGSTPILSDISSAVREVVVTMFICGYIMRILNMIASMHIHIRMYNINAFSINSKLITDHSKTFVLEFCMFQTDFRKVKCPVPGLIFKH